VTLEQLRRSVAEGLAMSDDPDRYSIYLFYQYKSTNTDAEGGGSFEAVQRRLMLKVMQHVSTEGARGGMTQDVLRTLFPHSYMCAKCFFGPVDHFACSNLRSHHGEKYGGGAISNACPRCGWFSQDITDWPAWNGKLWQ